MTSTLPDRRPSSRPRASSGASNRYTPAEYQPPVPFDISSHLAAVPPARPNERIAMPDPQHFLPQTPGPAADTPRAVRRRSSSGRRPANVSFSTQPLDSAAHTPRPLHRHHSASAHHAPDHAPLARHRSEDPAALPPRPHHRHSSHTSHHHSSDATHRHIHGHGHTHSRHDSAHPAAAADVRHGLERVDTHRPSLGDTMYAVLHGLKDALGPRR